MSGDDEALAHGVSPRLACRRQLRCHFGSSQWSLTLARVRCTRYSASCSGWKRTLCGSSLKYRWPGVARWSGYFFWVGESRREGEVHFSLELSWLPIPRSPLAATTAPPTTAFGLGASQKIRPKLWLQTEEGNLPRFYVAPLRGPSCAPSP